MNGKVEPHFRSSREITLRLTRKDFVVISAVNDRGIVDGCLRRSPDISSGSIPLITIEGAASMPKAYNEGLSKTDRNICVLAHQDVYLPSGFFDLALARLSELEKKEPNWRVAGCYGVKSNGTHVGRVWDVVIGKEIGEANFQPTPVVSLDELLLILHRDTDFKFDEGLPGWHLYGTDLVQSAIEEGRAAVAVELPVVHNNRPISNLKASYSEPYRYARRKWKHRLPIPTTIIPLSYNPWHMWRIKAGNHVEKRPDMLMADSVLVARKAGYEPP
jgi:hypothetical protein